MENFIEKNILDFLSSRGWNLKRKGKMFNYFKPPARLNLPEDFYLEIPQFINATEKSYQNYIIRIIEDLSAISPDLGNDDELRILFSKNNSIIKYRVFDNDNKDGTISFLNYLESLEIFKRMLSQTVSFVTTNKHIFGTAKDESDLFLESCRTLQTEKGSFTTKIEVPNQTINSLLTKVHSEEINQKLFDVINFAEEQILNPKENIILNENYITDNHNFINYEILNSFKELYTKTKINNIEYKLCSVYNERTITTEKVQKRILHFNKYLRDLKSILLNTQSIELIGFVKKLSSNSPKSSKNNEVILEANISNLKEKVKIVLKSDEYLEAIEAHKNEYPIKIIGKAKQNKTMLSIKDIEYFKVLTR